MINVNLFLTDEKLNKASYDTANRQYWKAGVLIRKIDSEIIINQCLLNGVYYQPDKGRDLDNIKIYVYIQKLNDTKNEIEKKLEAALNIHSENITIEEKTIPLRKIINEYKEYYAPQLIKAPFAKTYKNNVIIKLDTNQDMATLKKTLEFVFLCTEGSISCVRYSKDNKQYYFLKLEKITKKFIFHSLCANKDVKVFYEYSYPYINPNVGKIFVEKGYKPVYLEPFLKEHPLSVMEAIEKNDSTSSVKVDFNAYQFTSQNFNPIGKMISLESKCEKIGVELDTDMKSFHIDMTLERSHFYHYRFKTLSQLHLKKKELEKECKLIQNQIDSIQSTHNKNQYALYKISRKKLNQLFRFIHTIDDQLLNNADNFKIYQLLTYEENDDEQIYCITSPLNLIPAFIHDIYIEDKNYSENFKVYVPRGKCLHPMIKMKSEDKELFINALAKKIDISKEDIKTKYFAICDDKNNFGKDNDEKEWIIKLVKYEMGQKVIHYKKNLEVSYLIKHNCGAIQHVELLPLKEKTWGFKDAINEFDESITKSISGHIDTTIGNWEERLVEINLKEQEVNNELEKIKDLLENFLKEWTKKVSIEDKNFFIKIKDGINIIIQLSKDLKQGFTTDKDKIEKAHEALLATFTKCEDILKSIENDLSETKKKFKKESEPLHNNIVDKSQKIKSLLTELSEIEDNIKNNWKL